MRAVVIATGYSEGVAALNERLPTPLFPLVDRPFVQHVIELLVEAGVERFDILLSHRPELVEDFLGDGKRWGSEFRYHLVREPGRPLEKLGALGLSGDEPALLARADTLPIVGVDALRGSATHPRVFRASPGGSSAPGGEPAPCGWALLTESDLARLPSDLDDDGLTARLAEMARGERVACDCEGALSARTYAELLAAQRALIDRPELCSLIAAREAQEGVRISRNVTLPPDVRITPPVWIGENTRIGGRAQIGPDAWIGPGCVLDEQCRVTNALVFSSSYVGEGLDLEGVIVDRNRLVNTESDVSLPVTDDFILGNLADGALGRSVGGWLSRIAAVVLLTALWPVLLAAALRGKLTRDRSRLTTRRTLRIPCLPDEVTWTSYSRSVLARDGTPARREGWAHFLSEVLPGLWNVVRGQLHLVCVRPLTREQVAELPDDWRALYLQSKAGLITECHVNYGGGATPDELYASEAFYTVQSSLRHDLGLVGAYFVNLLLGRRGRACVGPEESSVAEATPSSSRATRSSEPTPAAATGGARDTEPVSERCDEETDKEPAREPVEA